jgi:ribosomal protein S18 acetylase RimI-like enzyme
MSTLSWGPLSEQDLPGLASLARACLRADGGLPQLSSDEMLRDYFLSDVNIAGRDETGEFAAAASVFRDNTGRRCATGLVHPSARRLGHGEALVAWCREQAHGEPLLVVSETMSLEAEELFARSGLRRVFAETVMRHSLGHIPKVALPRGLSTKPFDDETAPSFYAAYRGAFEAQPGFCENSMDAWLALVREDHTFLPAESRVAVDEAGHAVGLVILDIEWIDMVGVVPSWRGKGLGAHLVVRSLRAFKHAGCQQAWLCVNVDNRSRSLYERLGFEARGTRTRYEER